MKIVIDIPKEQYENLAKIANAGKEPLGYWERVVMRGMPLPKHGRLIDADEVKKNHEKWIGYIDEDMIARLNIAIDKHIPTIIPADKET